MKENEILEELDFILCLIKNKERLGEATVCALFDLLKSKDEEVQSKAVDVFLALIESTVNVAFYESLYNLFSDEKNIEGTWEVIDSLSIKNREKIYRAAISAHKISFDRVFKFSGNSRKELICLYGKKWRIDDKEWEVIVCQKDVKDANELLLALFPLQSVSEYVINLLFTTFGIDRVSILKARKCDQLLNPSSQKLIAEYLPAKDVISIFGDYTYSDIDENVLMNMLDSEKFENGAVKKMLLSMERHCILSVNLLSKIIKVLGVEAAEEIILSDIQRMKDNKRYTKEVVLSSIEEMRNLYKSLLPDDFLYKELK